MTVAGNLVDGPALEGEGGGSMSVAQLLARLDDADVSGVVPAIVAVSGGRDLGVAMRDGSQRAVWATRDDVFYRNGEVAARRFTASATLVPGSWLLFLPADDTVAAAALWRNGVPPVGAPSVAQWRWLGERGLRPIEGPVEAAAWSGLTAQEVADRAASVLRTRVRVVDVDRGVHRAAGTGTGAAVTLVLLPDGRVASTAPFASELTTVLGRQVPAGLGSRPSRRPGRIAHGAIKPLKPAGAFAGAPRVEGPTALARVLGELGVQSRSAVRYQRPAMSTAHEKADGAAPSEAQAVRVTPSHPAAFRARIPGRHTDAGRLGHRHGSC